jgi:hypothetical protein
LRDNALTECRLRIGHVARYARSDRQRFQTDRFASPAAPQKMHPAHLL